MAGGRQGTQAVVVDTKLNLPTQRAGVVMRDDLIKRMLDAEVPVVSVSAPAGFGKTTLLVQYAEATGRPVAWISLDAADNDAALFMLEIGTALERISPIDTQSRRHLAALTDNVSTAVAVLVRLLAAHPGLVLMFDDAHLVDNRVTLELIATLSERLPHGCQLVVGSRTSIPVPLPRLRARGLVLELGQRELALDRHEAGALLEGAGSGLPSDSFEALYSRVEGWAAGMYLAALCLRGVDDPNRAVRDFAGNHRDIVDYLSSEVLAGLPDDRLSFLLHTSVLDRFTASMCDAVLERHDSAQVIEDLEKINLFVIPLDNRREWYRYHHLFSDMLRAGLARRDPASERAIHRRATAWHEQHGTVPEAIEHAFAAGERARAAELVTSHARFNKFSFGILFKL